MEQDEKLPLEVQDARDIWFKQMELISNAVEDYYDEAAALEETLVFLREAMPEAQYLKNKYFNLREQYGLDE